MLSIFKLALIGGKILFQFHTM